MSGTTEGTQQRRGFDARSVIDLPRLAVHLASHIEGFGAADLSVELITGGHSNLTFVVGDGVRRWVLRRPPVGEVSRSAHDMGREARVMAALRDTTVPVPRIEHYCDDPAVIGTPFYLSEFVDGEVLRTADETRRLGPDGAERVSEEIIQILADLHALEPAAVGLADFGRPAGFLERQVARWTDHAEALLSGRAGVAPTVAALRDGMPFGGRVSVVHGDYRLENTIVAEGRIAAILDWEMATLGDPLTDLGLLWCYWAGVENPGGDTMRKGVEPELGFPGITDLIDRYAARSGIDVSALPWYVAFGYLKLAVLRSRIHRRFLAGQAPQSFAEVGVLIDPLLNASRTMIGAS